jgi:hypothetical protein
MLPVRVPCGNFSTCIRLIGAILPKIAWNDASLLQLPMQALHRGIDGGANAQLYWNE